VRWLFAILLPVKQYALLDVLRSIKAMDNNQQPIIPTACFKGKIVLIGVTAHGAADICSTPFSNTEYTVNLHANIIATILFPEIH
jgi:CHASE2 domain-containing sensor protein